VKPVLPEATFSPPPDPPALERSRGELKLGFARRGAATGVSELFQSGCAKARLLRQTDSGFREAIVLNTAGGLTDGDRFACDVAWGPGAEAMVTSQAAERIYRSRGAAADLETRLTVAAGARAVWAPQETILFDGGRYRRRTEIEVEEGGEIVACESVVFGRTAMGETVRSGGLEDRWRVRIDGRLRYADGFSLDGDVASALARRAIVGGAVASAAVLYVGEQATALRDLVRPLLERADVVAGATTRLGVTVIRLLARAATALRSALEAVLEALVGALGARALPRAWRL
jgi:urease accessory protein